MRLGRILKSTVRTGIKWAPVLYPVIKKMFTERKQSKQPIPAKKNKK